MVGRKVKKVLKKKKGSKVEIYVHLRKCVCPILVRNPLVAAQVKKTKF